MVRTLGGQPELAGERKGCALPLEARGYEQLAGAWPIVLDLSRFCTGQDTAELAEDVHFMIQSWTT